MSLLLLAACSEEAPSVCQGVYVENEDLSIVKVHAQNEKGRRETLRFSIEPTTEIDHPEALLMGTPVTIHYRGKQPSEVPATAILIDVDERYAQLTGRWLECEEPELDMGLELQPGGRAHSIGMQTIAFERWEYLPEGIRLSGNTLGGGNSVPFSEVWSIEELSDERLTLSQPDLTLRFRRENEADIEARKARAEAERQALEASQKRKSQKRR